MPGDDRTRAREVGEVRSLLLARALISDGASVTEEHDGAWSSAFGFDADDRRSVIRFAPRREDFDKDRLAARFASSDLPIPPVSEIGEAFGGFFAISRRVEGRFIDDLDEAAMRATVPSLLRAFDAMRTADLGVSTGFGSWDSTWKWRPPELAGGAALGCRRPSRRPH